MSFALIVSICTLVVMGALFFLVTSALNVMIDIQTNQPRYKAGEQIRTTVSVKSKKELEVKAVSLELRCELDGRANSDSKILYSHVQRINFPSMLTRETVSRSVELIAPNPHDLSDYAALSDEQKAQLEWELITVLETSHDKYVRDIDLILDLSHSSS